MENKINIDDIPTFNVKKMKKHSLVHYEEIKMNQANPFTIIAKRSQAETSMTVYNFSKRETESMYISSVPVFEFV